MSTIVGAPPHTIGDPASASWWRTTPASVSAACWTIDPMSVTGEATPGQRHRDQLGRDVRPGEVHDVAAGELGPGERRRRADVEHGPRLLGQRGPPAGVERQQVHHHAEPRGVNAPVTTGLSEWRGQEQAVQVADLGRDVVGDDRRRDRVVRGQRVRDADDPREVRGLRLARVERLRVQDGHAGGPGVEVDDALPVADGRRCPARSYRSNERGTVSSARRTIASGIRTRSPSAVAPPATRTRIASGSSTLTPGRARSARASPTTRSIRAGSRSSKRGRIGGSLRGAGGRCAGLGSGCGRNGAGQARAASGPGVGREERRRVRGVRVDEPVQLGVERRVQRLRPMVAQERAGALERLAVRLVRVRLPTGRTAGGRGTSTATGRACAVRVWGERQVRRRRARPRRSRRGRATRRRSGCRAASPSRSPSISVSRIICS